jgi:N-acetylglutamate synthase-like GNAT family acetyltransferase
LYGVYDDSHPDDLDPNNMPLLLWKDDRPIGAVRLDRLDARSGAIRTVAILPEEQRRGMGRTMMRLLEEHARAQGFEALEVRSAGSAVGFYLRTGWRLISDDRPKPLLGKIIALTGNLD